MSQAITPSSSQGTPLYFSFMARSGLGEILRFCSSSRIVGLKEKEYSHSAVRKKEVIPSFHHLQLDQPALDRVFPLVDIGIQTIS